jgi:3-dehydroquinate synthetase
MAEYASDIQKYTGSVHEGAVTGIVKHLGIALKSKDASLVSGSDPKELERVREKFLKTKLKRSESDKDLDAAIAATMKKMASEKNKSRVTVYYLLAEHFGQLDDFSKAKK